jgi:hypothetical protein
MARDALGVTRTVRAISRVSVRISAYSCHQRTLRTRRNHGWLCRFVADETSYRGHDLRKFRTRLKKTMELKKRQVREEIQRGSYDLSGVRDWNTRLVVGADTPLLLDVWFVLMRPFSLLWAAASPNVPKSASALLRAVRLAINSIVWAGSLGADDCEESVGWSRQSNSVMASREGRIVTYSTRNAP